MKKYDWMYWSVKGRDYNNICEYKYVEFIKDICIDFTHITIVSKRFYKVYIERMAWNFLYECENNLRKNYE